MSLIKFKKAELDKAEKSYRKIKPAEEQKKIIDTLIDIGEKYITIKRDALGHFVYESIKQWQKESKKILEDILTMTPQNRIESVSDILEKVKRRLTTILEIFDQEEMLKKAIEEAKQYYIDTYANR